MTRFGVLKVVSFFTGGLVVRPRIASSVVWFPCLAKSREEIVSKVVKAFSQPIIAV